MPSDSDRHDPVLAPRPITSALESFSAPDDASINTTHGTLDADSVATTVRVALTADTTHAAVDVFAILVEGVLSQAGLDVTEEL